MKKILIFSLAYYPSFVSGAEAAIKEITDRIAPSDIEFHLITLLFNTSAPRYERIGNVHVYRVGFGGAYLSKILFVLLASRKARALDRAHHFDALWCMMTYMTLPLWFARLWGVKAPHILTLQDGDPYEKVFERWFILPLTPLIDSGIKTARVIQVISSYLASWPIKRGYAGVVEKIHNGANPNDIAQHFDQTLVDTIHAQFDKKPTDVWLVNTARLVHQKAFDDVIRALPLLPPAVKFLIVGSGTEQASLKKLVDDLALSDRVFFVGQVERSHVTAYRKAGDIFVGPSRSEGLGNAFLSAMASGLPVVATQEGGLAEFIYDAKRNPEIAQTAWAVDVNAPEQIADAVKDVLAHPEKVQVVTSRARKMVQERFDWDTVAVQMRERVFAKVLS